MFLGRTKFYLRRLQAFLTLHGGQRAAGRVFAPRRLPRCANQAR
ncbi:hypothetical protein ATN83_0622 [Raoultella ornithinolytica]|nr:hypothetical protein ATN83_0622 [Raoultella ornithinolytica]KDV91457.1 hypothetical protein AB00_4231 [Raoultella ornithinolytica 2-156-04_S1_C1]KDX11619.1 hypothetical protein AB28_4228 [Raoultella ornithinolytica 2-156-04_S1_C2]